MAVCHPIAPASASQMEKLIEEVKKTIIEKSKTTNELNVQIQSQYFSSKYGQGNNSDVLKVYVERFDTTFNVYWQQLENAAEYVVEVYKYVSTRWYKLTEISVERNEGYVAITNLVGDGYVFRVIAMNRSGEELAKSAGMVIRSIIAD